MADFSVNSTGNVQAITTYGGIQSTMDTCTLTILNPNLTPVVGPIGVTALSTGLYQYHLPIGLLNIPGTWTAIWYGVKGTDSLQMTNPFTVGP